MQSKHLDPEDYRALAGFRYQIRRFLHVSEQLARSVGIEPQQHQLLLAIKAFDGRPTVGELAEALLLHHNSAVELVRRAEQRGFVRRRRSEDDRRQVFVEITPQGEALLRDLAALHRDELRRAGPELARALEAILMVTR